MSRILSTIILLFATYGALADVNITNIPTATGGAGTGDKLLGVTNSTHAALVEIKFLNQLSAASLLGSSNHYTGTFVGPATSATNADSATVASYVSGTLTNSTTGNADTATWATNIAAAGIVGAVAEATHATNADNATVATSAVNATNFWGVLSTTNLPGNVLTNQQTTAVTLNGGGLQLTNCSMLVTGAQYIALSNGAARVLMTNGTLTTSGIITAGGTISANAGVSSTYLQAQIGQGIVWGSSTRLFGMIDGTFTLASNSFPTATLQTYWRTNWPTFEVQSPSNSAMGLGFNGSLNIKGTLAATNGVIQQLNPSFTTNFTCTTNLQYYACNGTNQIVTLPNAAYVPQVVYRFGTTNGWSKVIITNATGAQTIRDGTSLSYTQIGIGNASFISDGAHWWPASKTKIVMPNAQFTTSTNIPLTLANTAYPITFDGIANESQGIALGTNGTGAWSVMWITNSGQYEFVPSVVERFSANHIIRYWFKSNGTNIPNSNTPAQGAAGGTTIRVITVSYKVDVSSPTAFEIWAQSDNTGDDLYSEAASGNYPASPSVICPVKRISDSWP